MAGYSTTPSSPRRAGNLEFSLSASEGLERGEIGELGPLWTLPSDHIPVGAEVWGLRLMSWNVLNTRWVDFFNENVEGLAKSAIVTENVPLSPGNAWTRREEHLVRLVMDLSNQFDLLLLQECAPQFIQELLRRLPPRFQLLLGREDRPDNDIAALFNRERLILRPEKSRILPEGYECKAGKATMSLLFRLLDGPELRLIHTHVPGDPKLPGLEEFARHLSSAHAVDEITIAAGDLNFTQDRLAEVFRTAGLPSYTSVVPMNTVIGLDRKAKGIDYILTCGVPAEKLMPIRTDRLPDEIFHAARLLNPPPHESAPLPLD